MKIFKKVGRLAGLFLLAAVAVLGVTAAPVFAEDPDRADVRIQLSPTALDLKLEPGKTSTATFKVQNIGNKSFKYELGVTPYSVTDENYTANFDDKTNYSDIVDWITFSQDGGTLESDTEDEITVTVKVPSDVPDGGQYAMVYAKVQDGELDASGVLVERRVGLLVYSANVNGKTRKEGKVLENKISGFVFNPPVSATSLVENTGNVHLNATYVLQVSKFFGNEEVYSNEEHPVEETILPETTRLHTATWDKAPQLGIFKVKQTVTFNGETSVTDKVVFICPIWFLFIVLLIVFCLVFWLVSRIRNRNKN